MLNENRNHFKYHEYITESWTKMKEGFAMMNLASVIVIKAQCLDVETKKDSTARRLINYKRYLYSSPQSPITS